MSKQKNQEAVAGVQFFDTAFKSRTIFLEDGRSFDVSKGVITAVLPELVAMLDAHPEFRRVTDNTD